MNTKKHAVLIVEDEPYLLDALKDQFEFSGFTVLTAKNGVEGLDAALKNKPDFILLDIIMPFMDGITVLKKLREDTWGNAVPVLMLSNLCDSRTVMESIQNGASDYLIKTDWKLDDVVEKVKKSLKIQ